MSTTSVSKNSLAALPEDKQREIRRQAFLQRTIKENPLIPLETGFPRQNEFLALTCQEALYGGAAGGGKSFALLMAALQFMTVPGYSAIILRRRFSDLALTGGLFDLSNEWFRPLGTSRAKWKNINYRWTFPEYGSFLQFGYCEKVGQEQRYRGAQYQFIGFDELTEFPENVYLYLFSRLRKKKNLKLPLRMRSATNPGGPGMAWVKKRFLDHPGDRVFIPAKVKDNYALDEESYLASLAHLDPVTRAQLMSGDWEAYEGGRFKREWFRTWKLLHTGIGQGGEYGLAGRERTVMARDVWKFMTVDPASSDKQTADYTVICVWGVTPDYQLLWLDMHRFQLQVPDIVPQVQAVYSQWSPEYVAIEAVASNSGVLQVAQRTNMCVKSLHPRGKDKLVRATKALTFTASGRLYVPESAHWLDDAYDELLRFTGRESRDSHDDIVDTLSYAVACLEEYDQGNDGLPLILGKRQW